MTAVIEPGQPVGDGERGELGVGRLQRIGLLLDTDSHLDAGQEFVAVKGLGDIIVRPQAEALHLLARLARSGHEDDGDVGGRRAALQGAGHLVAIHPRHGDVEQHHVGSVLGASVQHGFPTIHQPDVMPPLHQDTLHQSARVMVIFRNEQLSHWSPPVRHNPIRGRQELLEGFQWPASGRECLPSPGKAMPVRRVCLWPEDLLPMRASPRRKLTARRGSPLPLEGGEPHSRTASSPWAGRVRRRPGSPPRAENPMRVHPPHPRNGRCWREAREEGGEVPAGRITVRLRTINSYSLIRHMTSLSLSGIMTKTAMPTMGHHNGTRTIHRTLFPHSLVAAGGGELLLTSVPSED